VRVDKTFEPNTRQAETYQMRFDVYRQLYPALRPVNTLIAQLGGQAGPTISQTHYFCTLQWT